ncbi:MAG: ABC transporter ATP-binding protein [Chloroflexota bacterium]
MKKKKGSSISVATRNLGKDFGDVKALKGVNLSIESGQIFGLLGSNGAGKTTLLRVLIGSTKSSSGRSLVLGYDPAKQKKAIRSRIGYMPQSPALYEDLSPRENIRFFGRAHNIKKLAQRVDEVIDFVGLGSRVDDPVYQFSGGMKQRVSLACALVHQPQMLLLDEPTSGIDPKLRESFWEHFRELTSRGVTLIVSTHQMNEAMHCDRLAILHEGVLLANDTPQQLLWRNRARIKIWREGRVLEGDVVNYPEELPRALKVFGLDKAISRIEIEEETLESVVLGMIDAKVTADQKVTKGGQDD